MTNPKDNCGEWSAIYDSMPLGLGTLTVSGECTFPTPGFKVILQKRHPQGVNPSILILGKLVQKPSSIEIQKETPTPVGPFVEKTNQKYDEVHVVPDDVKIKVKTVSFGKDAPFPIWIKGALRQRLGKDAPFPLRENLYYTDIPFKTVYQGPEGPAKAGNGVIKDKSGIGDLNQASSVNFRGKEVIYVALGLQQDDKTVEITDVVFLTDRGPQFGGPLTLVNYAIKTGGLDVVTRPVHIIELERLEGDIQFYETPQGQGQPASGRH